jgi:hypothetical protein
MNYQLGRITLGAETLVHSEPVFDVVMIGHLEKKANLTRLFANQSLMRDLDLAGYSELLNEIADRKSADEHPPADFLYNLPIPIRSLEEFQSIFSIETKEHLAYRYKSRLGGNYSWLPLAVADFFQAEVLNIPRRLWVIPVEEKLGIAAFIKEDLSNSPSVEENNALLRALGLPNVAFIGMPDFERLHIPEALKPIPLLRVVNPTPAFLPCAANSDDGVKERAVLNKNYKIDENPDFVGDLKHILSLIAKYRPDVCLLMTFPYDEKMDGELPRTSIATETELQQWRNSSDQSLLRRAQLVYPFFQDTQGNLSSSVGVIARKILSTTTAKGSWRSIAGTDLQTLKKPFPTVSNSATEKLRESLGIGVIHFNNGQLELDDERLMVPYFQDESASDSGELARFMGWLLRSLEKLGHELVFDNIDVAIKASILLQHFFSRLYDLGALRGKTPESAFNITTSSNEEGCILVEIEIAPAFIIDNIQLEFHFENGAVNNLEMSHV